MAHHIKNHKCFEELVDSTGSDATFEKSMAIDFGTGKRMGGEWVINLWKYTPALRVSSQRGYYIPNFCPMCGMDFRNGKQ